MKVAVSSQRLAVLAALVCTLAACSASSLLDSEIPVPVSYVIAPVPPAANATQTVASQVDLAIGNPAVAPGLDSPRIAVLRGRELDYYRAVQWGGATPEVVQALLVSSLQDQKLFRSVTAEETRVGGAYVLDVEVRDFQAEYGEGRDAPRVHVTIIGRLIRITDRKLVDTIMATSLADASDNRMYAVAAAFEAAAHQVARQIAHDTAAAVAKDKQDGSR